MKKIAKLLAVTLLAAILTISVAACGDSLTAEKAKWIKSGYHYNDVIAHLGTANDSLIGQSAYFWFDGAKDIADANVKLDNGKTVKVIAVMFDEDNRTTRVQFATLNEENRRILTSEIATTNLNLLQNSLEKIIEANDYYTVINIVGKPDSVNDYDESKYCYWFDGASSLADFAQKQKEGKAVTVLEIQFDANNIIYLADLRQN